MGFSLSLICGRLRRRSRPLAFVALVSLQSAAHAAVSINIGTTSGAPGDTVTFSVTLTADADEQVLGTQNEVRLNASGVQFASKASKKPDCVVNPVIFKTLSQFYFLDSCDPTAGVCTGGACGRRTRARRRRCGGDPDRIGPLYLQG